MKLQQIMTHDLQSAHNIIHRYTLPRIMHVEMQEQTILFTTRQLCALISEATCEATEEVAREQKEELIQKEGAQLWYTGCITPPEY